jgi:neutral ceramidase
MPDKIFRAGAATANITPRLGVSLNGGMADREATHVHDELHARVLVLDDGDTRLVLAVCDSCMIPGEVLDAAKHLAHGYTGIPLDWMLISATHAHSCPSAASVFQSEADPEYQEFLALRIADGIRRAVNNLAPARIGYGVGREPTQVFNRRWKLQPGAMPTNPWGKNDDQVKMNPQRASPTLVSPAGPTDPGVTVLAVETAEGRPLAVLANYSLHYVGGVPGTHVSADYFGAFADRIQQLLGADRLDPPFVGMLNNGTSGNINNVDFQKAADNQPPYAQLKKVAWLVADEALRVYRNIEFKPHVKLAARQARVSVGVRVPTKEDLAFAQRVLGGASGPQLKGLEEIYARETMLMADWPRQVETVVMAMRVGELGIAASPCETFVETGLAIKEASPLKPTMVVSLANDYMGYLATAEHHALGGYETWRARSAFLDSEAEAKIRSKLLELLGLVAK